VAWVRVDPGIGLLDRHRCYSSCSDAGAGVDSIAPTMVYRRTRRTMGPSGPSFGCCGRRERPPASGPSRGRTAAAGPGG
jgi:hypothetical protein